MSAYKQPLSAQSVEEIRTRARRRLIGSIILVVLAVAVLPWVFDSRPRENVVDIPIEIVGQPSLSSTEPPVYQTAQDLTPGELPQDAFPYPADGVNPISPADGQPGSPQYGLPVINSDNSGVVTVVAGASDGDQTDPQNTIGQIPPGETAQSMRDESSGGTDLAINGGYATRPARLPVIPSKYSPSQTPVRGGPAVAQNPDAARAAALLGENPEAVVRTPQPNEASRRFVVQVGSYADPGKASEVQARLSMAGYSSFTQEVQTEAGRRIRVRVGPYEGRVAADAVATRIRALGLDALVSPV